MQISVKIARKQTFLQQFFAILNEIDFYGCFINVKHGINSNAPEPNTIHACFAASARLYSGDILVGEPPSNPGDIHNHAGA